MSTIDGSNLRKDVACCRKEFLVQGFHGEPCRRATNDVLPDDVLIEIFYLFLVDDGYHGNEWHTLVHVCGRWRQVVFASPRRLNLRLLCSNQSPVKKKLDIWPALPIVIQGSDEGWGPTSVSNMIAALEHTDRVCEITIKDAPSPFWEGFAAIKSPFLELTYLRLSLSSFGAMPALPDTFLGGSTPRLQTLELDGILFLGLPTLLLSARHLVKLYISNIPDSRHTLPEAMATCLPSLTSLESLVLRFRSPRSRMDQSIRHPSLLTRTILPALTNIQFQGISKDVEDLVALIDAPLLTTLKVIFFNQGYGFDTSLLRQLISRAEAFKVLNQARMRFFDDSVCVVLKPTKGGVYSRGMLQLWIMRNPLDGQLSWSSLAQLCNSSLPLLPALEHLQIHDCYSHFSSRWGYGMESTQWMEIFRPFVTMQSLYLDKKLAPRVARALQEHAGEGVTEVFPALQSIFVERLQSSGPFVTARQLLGHQVTVHNWDRT